MNLEELDLEIKKAENRLESLKRMKRKLESQTSGNKKTSATTVMTNRHSVTDDMRKLGLEWGKEIDGVVLMIRNPLYDGKPYTACYYAEPKRKRG